MAENAPDFVFQTGKPMKEVEHHAWVRSCLQKTSDLGGSWFRVTQHGDRPNLVIVEVWKVEPAEKPEPAWQARDS